MRVPGHDQKPNDPLDVHLKNHRSISLPNFLVVEPDALRNDVNQGAIVQRNSSSFWLTWEGRTRGRC